MKFPIKLSWGARFAGFLAVSVLATIVAAGGLVGITLYEHAYDEWIGSNSIRLDFMEERLRASVEFGQRSAENSYIVNSLIDVTGRATYLPRELESLTRHRGFAHVGP